MSIFEFLNKINRPTKIILCLFCIVLVAMVTSYISQKYNRIPYKNAFLKNEIDPALIERGYSELMQQGTVTSINFDYSFNETEHFKLDSIYDDNVKTFIHTKSKFTSGVAIPTTPSIYVKEVDKNEFTLTNYEIYCDKKTLDIYYIVPKLAKEIELRYSDSEAIKIERKQ